MKLILIMILLMCAGTVTAEDQFQDQFQMQGQAQAQAQGQSQILGINAPSSVNLSSNTEVNSEPAYAPSLGLGTSNLTCMSGTGGSVGAMGMVSIGYAGTSEDEQCTYRANLVSIQNLYGPVVSRAYAKKYIRGLAEIIDPEQDEEVDAFSAETQDAIAFNGKL